MSITVTFKGENLAQIEQQALDFLTGTMSDDQIVGLIETLAETVDIIPTRKPVAAPEPVEEPVSGPFPVAAAKDEAPSTASPAADASGVTSAEPPSDVPDTTYDDTIKPRMLQLSLRKGREAVFKVLGTFDVPNVRDVPEDKWPELLALIDELLGS